MTAARTTTVGTVAATAMVVVLLWCEGDGIGDELGIRVVAVEDELVIGVADGPAVVEVTVATLEELVAAKSCAGRSAAKVSLPGLLQSRPTAPQQHDQSPVLLL